jgi:hypothetical protein
VGLLVGPAEQVAAARASANVAGHPVGKLVGQLGSRSVCTFHPELPAHTATVSQAYQGSFPYSQPPTGEVPVQGAPFTGTIAGQAAREPGQSL